ncbi:MAG: iron ABC transporter permease [Oscillospiraceae bacterium]|nr:iron ABC transporter permease [Oscillospiraceae bacterium]
MNNSFKQGADAYEGYTLRKKLTLLLSAILLVIAALYAVGVGSIQIPIAEILRTFVGRGDPLSRTAILNIRLPRVVAAVLVGAALASSGVVMQCVLRNPLASASTLGVSQGAAFGAALGIVVFGGGVVNPAAAASAIAIDDPYIVTICAFVCGIFATVVIIAISQMKKEIGPGGLVLAGVALSSLFSGGSTLLQYFTDDTKLGAIVFWTFGDLGSTNWRELLILAVVLAASMIYFMCSHWDHNAMEAGADTAKSLGVNIRSVMLISMGISALLSATAVSFVGIISFVGLVAPHIMRKFVGNDHRYLLPASAIAGALLLVLADTFGRSVIAPVILPIGALTAFLGAPVFLLLLFKGVKHSG